MYWPAQQDGRGREEHGGVAGEHQVVDVLSQKC